MIEPGTPNRIHFTDRFFAEERRLQMFVHERTNAASYGDVLDL